MTFTKCMLICAQKCFNSCDFFSDSYTLNVYNNFLGLCTYVGSMKSASTCKKFLILETVPSTCF
jgi:hypothetical protein